MTFLGLQFDLWNVTKKHSPVELIVVVMCLPPEVEPDQQQTEGKEQDEGPQQLPLHTNTKKQTQRNVIRFLSIHFKRQLRQISTKSRNVIKKERYSEHNFMKKLTKAG